VRCFFENADNRLLRFGDFGIKLRARKFTMSWTTTAWSVVASACLIPSDEKSSHLADPFGPADITKKWTQFAIRFGQRFSAVEI
jgi:hypothetical protein